MIRKLRVHFRRSIEIARLAPDPLRVVLAFACASLFPLLHRLRLTPVPLPLRIVRERLWVWIRHVREPDVVHSVLYEQQYRIALDASPRDVRTIVDLGAHIGASVLYFRRECPSARILAAEPDPANFALLERNTAGVPRIVLERSAIGAAEGSRRFLSGGGWGSKLAEDPNSGVDVPVTTLRSLLTKHGFEDVDLLKVDIEGAEFELVRSFNEWGRIGTLVAEVHDFVPGTEDEIEAALSRTHAVEWSETGGDRLLVARRRSG